MRVLVPEPDHDSLLLDDDEPTSRVHVFVADDYFGASRVFVLDEVLERAGVVPGLQWLAQFAAGEFETQPGPVTPHVYHRAADGSTSVVTHQGEEGIEILVEGAFGQAFNAVMGDGRD